jgi:hypothetical protein
MKTPNEYQEEGDLRKEVSLKPILSSEPIKLPLEEEENHAALPDFETMLTRNAPTGADRKRSSAFWKGENHTQIQITLAQQQKALEAKMAKARVVAKYHELCSK